MHQLYPIIRRARRPLGPLAEPVQAVPPAVVEPPPGVPAVDPQPIRALPATVPVVPKTGKAKRDEREIAS